MSWANCCSTDFVETLMHKLAVSTNLILPQAVLLPLCILGLCLCLCKLAHSLEGLSA